MNLAPAVRHGCRAAWQTRSLGSSPAAGGGVRPNQRLEASPQALGDTMSGVVQMYIVDFGSGLTQMKAGKVRVLGVTPARGSKRSRRRWPACGR